MAGGKLEGGHNTRVDCEPGVAMAGLKQDLGCHGWPVAGSGNAMASNVTGDHRIYKGQRIQGSENRFRAAADHRK